jgi:hypothetical protein
VTDKSLSFDHRPDPVLGAALRQAISAEDHAAFVARVTTALAAPRVGHWDVLASWARAGIAAVFVGAVSTALLVGALQRPMDLVESIAATSAQTFVGEIAPPDPSVLLMSPDLP